jgi:hypothetical protein
MIQQHLYNKIHMVFMYFLNEHQILIFYRKQNIVFYTRPCQAHPTMDTHAVHAQAAPTLYVCVHVMHIQAMHCMFHARINCDMPTVAVGSESVEQQRANSIVTSSVLQQNLVCH